MPYASEFREMLFSYLLQSGALVRLAFKRFRVLRLRNWIRLGIHVSVTQRIKISRMSEITLLEKQQNMTQQSSFAHFRILMQMEIQI